MVKLRNEADYQLTSPGRFRDMKHASDAIDRANELIDLLDAIESDEGRLGKVVATIRR